MPRVVERFVKDHEQLQTLLRRLIEDVASPDRNTLCETWSEFETCLTCHIAAEERDLFPLVELAHPTEVRLIREDHCAIRQRLAELGVLVDLHAVSETSIAALVRMLRGHAAHEERTLYAWADHSISTTIKRYLSAVLDLAPQSVQALVSGPAASSNSSSRHS